MEKRTLNVRLTENSLAHSVTIWAYSSTLRPCARPHTQVAVFTCAASHVVLEMAAAAAAFPREHTSAEALLGHLNQSAFFKLHLHTFYCTLSLKSNEIYN